MTTIRFPIPDFQLANPLYTAAQVSFFTVDVSGHATTTLATLYADPVSAITVANPQTLDGEGKFLAPVYIAGPVIASVVGPNVGSHTTGVIGARGTWKGNWATATAYFSTDFVIDPATQNLYIAAADYTSGVSIALDIAAGNLVLVLNAGALPTMSSTNRATFAYSPVVFDLASGGLSVQHLYTTTAVTVPANKNYADIRLSQPGGGNNTFTVGANAVVASIFSSPEALVGSSASSNLYGAVLHGTNDGPGNVRGAHLGGFATAGSTGTISAAALQVQPVATTTGAWGALASLTSSGVNNIAVAYGIESNGDQWSFALANYIAALPIGNDFIRWWQSASSSAGANFLKLLDTDGVTSRFVVDKAGHVTITPAAGTTSALTITTPAGIIPGITTNQSLSGSTLPGGNAANLIFIGDDRAQGGGQFINHFAVSANIGTSSMTGGRQTIAAFLNLASPSSASNSNRNYVALYGNAFSATGDGGTDTGAGAKGAMFPLATWGDLQSGATNMLGVGNEFDVSIRTGASAKHKTCLALIEHALDGVSGATTDALLAFSGQAGALGMNTLITISDFATQHPLKVTGTIMKTVTIGAGATVANGIDFSSGYTFTGYSLHLPGFGVASTGLVGIGPQTSTIQLDINAGANAASVPAPQAGSQLRIASADATQTSLSIDAFGTQTNVIFRRAQGTAASSTGLVANNSIGQLGWIGYNSAGAYSGFAAALRCIATETWSGTANGSQIDIRTTPNTTTGIATSASFFNSGGFAVGTSTDPGIGAILANTSIKSQSPTAGVGYATGAGGTVTQGAGSGKATAATLNTATGQITMNNAALAAGTIVSFVLTNSAIAATDVVVLNHISGGTIGSYTLNAQAAGGSATINVRNNTAGSLSEAIVIQFAVIKGVNS